MGKRRAPCWLLGLMLLVASTPAQARQQIEKSFGGEGWNQAGPAGSVALPVSFAGAQRGAFSFELRRTGDIPYGALETVFELVEGADRPLLRVKVSWTSEVKPGNPVLAFQGESGGGEYHLHGMDLWGPYVELDRPVAAGQAIHVDLTWDDGARAYEVYVDGRAQQQRHGGYDPAQKAWYPDQRAEINDWMQEAGRRKRFDARPLGELLARVTAVHLGNVDAPGRSRNRPRSLLRHAALDTFAVFVDEIPPPGGAAAAPQITSVRHDAAQVAGFSGKLVAGNTVSVTVEGSAGARGSFDLVHFPDLDRQIALDWRGWGVYPESQTRREEGAADLRDVEGYRVFASPEPFDPAAPGIEPAAELPVERQEHTLASLEIDQPYYVAVLAVMRDGSTQPVLAPLWSLPLTEAAPGLYIGTCAVGARDRYPRARIVGRLAGNEAAATLVGDEPLAVDPSLTITVAAESGELPADERSTAKVTVTVTDANGDAVAGHAIGFLLATTARYTGVVGGGAFAEEAGGAIKADFSAETDLFGKVSATYVAGFAAKTAIIVARDLAGDSTGAGYVRTYIQSGAELELLPVEPAAAADAGYAITVTSSDDWLTADGASRARITATVTLNGTPVAGHGVSFGVSGGSGSVRAVTTTTGQDGEARALYTAGTKIGLVLVTATDTTVGISGSVQIELRSDAPAKIAVTIDPERIPADGRSTAELRVLVTDINDNPSEDTQVEYRISSGGGKIRDERGVTDRQGASTTEYVAGRSPGRVSIEITVRSGVPTPEELAGARALALAVPDPRFF